MVGRGLTPIPKSRYDSISTYIYHCEGDSACHRTFAVYNDIPCPVDEHVKQQLRAGGIDENLAHHVAHLYCRDPIVAFHGQIELNDSETTDHFESIQSTNWQTVRWKPPPPRRGDADPHIGWRTEFRSMEVQLTDFENAAFTVFIILLTRVVLAFDLSFYIPLSKVDENMRRAHLRDAVRTQKFFFRKFIAPVPCCMEELEKEESAAAAATETAGATSSSSTDKRKPCTALDPGPGLSPEDMWDEMTTAELFCGKSDYFPGLLPLVYAYLEFINCDEGTYKKVSKYLDFIEKRAKGELITPATWMRQFVSSHPAYKQDSVISPEICYDLMVRCQQIGEGVVPCPEVLGDIKFDRVRREDAYGQVLTGKLPQHQKSQVIRDIMFRGIASQSRPASVARGKSRTMSFGGDPTAAAAAAATSITSTNAGF